MRTTARERAEVHVQLDRLGVNWYDAQALRRIALTLHRWHELECGVENGCVERDEETGKTYWMNAHTGKRYPIADRETGALKRLEKLMKQYPNLVSYVQTDPRGCAVYVLTTEQLGDADIHSVYNRGIAVC